LSAPPISPIFPYTTLFRSGFRHSSNQQAQRGSEMNAPWFLYAVGAALLYGLHQVFTKLAADRISDGLGGFVVESSAALTILVYRSEEHTSELQSRVDLVCR